MNNKEKLYLAKQAAAPTQFDPVNPSTWPSMPSPATPMTPANNVAPMGPTVNAHPTADKPFAPGGLSYQWLNKNAPAVTNFTNSWIKGKPVADVLKPFKPMGNALGRVGMGLQSATNMASKMFSKK